MTRAVVFAYHNVGVRCLSVLLAHDIELPLVLTHRDDPGEAIWFDSVAERAARHDIPVITPEDPNAPEVVARIAALKPDFLFSFYYRRMLAAPLLALAPCGAYNLHGSLLPAYRGRAPINWAVLRGERRTGATVHRMVEKPDAGAIIAQQAVPILPDDTALDVFQKVTVAAEIALDGVLPALLAGCAPHLEQDLSQGSYFGGRKPEDGRVDWRRPARDIHNLIRAVAPPYPGAFTDLAGRRLRLLASRIEPQREPRSPAAGLYCEPGILLADCAGGGVLRLLVECEGEILDAPRFTAMFGARKINLL